MTEFNVWFNPSQGYNSNGEIVPQREAPEWWLIVVDVKEGEPVRQSAIEKLPKKQKERILDIIVHNGCKTLDELIEKRNDKKCLCEEFIVIVDDLDDNNLNEKLPEPVMVLL